MNVDPIQILFHAIGFLILLVILRKFVWGSLQGMLDARTEKIAGEFRSIDQTKQDLENLKKQYQASLEKIEDESRAKIQAAVNEGRRVAEEIEKLARTNAEQTLEKTKEAVAQEIAKARAELRDQVVDLAIQATHKILRQHLDEETDRRMIEAFIREIETIDASSQANP